ncbi:MAG: sortase, partial [Anaerolineae bacterium]
AEILAPPPPATSPPTRIMAPSIGLDAEVFPVGWAAVSSGTSTVVRWDVVDRAAGWHQNSAFPGNEGNVVLSGHHNIRGEVFRYLIDLEEGDEIRLLADDELYRYEVVTKMILQERGMPLEVRLQNARWIAATDHERLTLVTCWPYSTNSHRLIVVALPARAGLPFAPAA